MVEKVRLRGTRELEQVLKRLPARLRERELQSAARAGANVIRREIRDRAPRGNDPSPGSKKYGSLHDNIRVSRRKELEGRNNVVMSVHTGRAFWGQFLEFGTVKMAPRPFFTVGFDVAANKALLRTGQALGRRLDRTAKELAGQFGSLKKSTKRRL